jgi:hypothetical protein
VWFCLFDSIFLAQTVGATVKVHCLITCAQNQFSAASQRCVTADELSPERVLLLFPQERKYIQLKIANIYFTSVRISFPKSDFSLGSTVSRAN